MGDPDPAAPVSMSREGFALIRAIVRLSPASFAVSVTGAALFAATTVGSAVIVGRITDRVVLPTFATGQVPDGALGWAVVAVAAITVIRSAAVVMRRYYAALTSETAQAKLRRRLTDAYLALPLAWHQEVPAGQLLAHADNDTDVTTEVIHPLPFSLGVAFLAVGSAVALVAVDPVIASVALLIFPALTLLNRVYSRWVEEPAALVQAGIGKVSAIAHESFDGALVVKTLGRAEAEGERFAVAVDELRQRRVEVGFVRAVFESVLDGLPSLGIVAVVVVGGYRIQAGAMTHGDLVQVATLFSVLAMPMRVFGFFLEMIPPSVVAGRRLASVFDEPQPQPVPPVGLTGAHPLGLAVTDLRFRYPSGPEVPVRADGAISPVSTLDTPTRPDELTHPESPSPDPAQPLVLDGVSLVVAPGEVVALVGSTGSGKSTLCTLAAGLVPPTGGRIEVTAESGENHDLAALAPGQRATSIGLVFQESFLFADTLRANVDLDGARTEPEVVSAMATARVDTLIEELPAGLDTVVGERGVTLSGGQRQRVALARALIRRPRILILDDATSAVDPVIEQQILERLRHELAVTTLIVAQRVSTIELADRVLYLNQGIIRATGSHAELLTDPGYRTLVSAYEQVTT